MCNGTLAGGNVVAGDEVAGATQVYVDCDGGSDAAGCGAPGSPPCASIEYAWNTVGSGGYEFVCFRGTCAEGDWVPDNGGNETPYTIAMAGSQVRDFEYPSEPKMLLGWDTDADGEFPPFDTDETAMLDGVGFHRFMDTHLPTHIELAHFSARQYNEGEGTDGDPNGGFVGRVRGWDFFHDIELDRIGNGTCQSSGNLTFTFFGGSPIWIAIENIRSLADGGYFIRGAGGDGPEERGPLRFQNLTVVSRGIDETGECGSGGGRTTFIKLWGYYTGVEVLDNLRDCDLDNWNGRIPQWGCSAGVVDVCSQDWDIVNNEFRNTGGIIGCQGGAPGFCEGRRPIRDIRWDRNIYVNNRPAEMGHARTRDAVVDNIWEAGSVLSIGSYGDTLEETCQDLTITNNMFYWTAPGRERVIIYDAGGSAAVPGEIIIANNTFYGHVEDSPLSSQPAGYIVLGGDQGANDFRIENNIFAGGGAGCRNIVKDQPWSAGGAAVFGNNVYDADCDWEWDGARLMDLVAWMGATTDLDSVVTCDPTFVDASGDDYHLDESDSCALDEGRPSVWPIDFDGDARPGGSAWDIGADELIP